MIGPPVENVEALDDAVLEARIRELELRMLEGNAGRIDDVHDPSEFHGAHLQGHPSSRFGSTQPACERLSGGGLLDSCARFR